MRGKTMDERGTLEDLVAALWTHSMTQPPAGTDLPGDDLYTFYWSSDPDTRRISISMYTKHRGGQKSRHYAHAYDGIWLTIGLGGSRLNDSAALDPLRICIRWACYGIRLSFAEDLATSNQIASTWRPVK